jgi:O-acetyl-ADP-ribose deacetylase (regulator of RNase III)
MAVVRVVRGSVVDQDVDAIVNAANEHLAHGGGLAAAIARAAGPELQDASDDVAPCPTGEVRVTPGFRLKARWVIHAVGPVWHGGTRGEAELLASCYREALRAADGLGARSIAVPPLSVGIFGYPLEEGCAVAVSTLAATPTAVTDVRVVGFTESEVAALTAALEDLG